MSKVISIYSPNYDPYDSFGRVALELAYHLSTMGWHVNAMGDDWERHSEKLTPALLEVLNKPIVQAKGGIALGYPTNIEECYDPELSEGPILAVTMFESTKLPDGWSKALNKCAGVAVPAQFLKKIMSANGVFRPVKVVPLGVSETFNFVDRDYPKDRPFTFLAFGDRGIRKGWHIAARAFIKAFGDSKDHKLIIKCRPDGLSGFDLANENIEVLKGDFTEYQMQQLYARCDAMVFPSYGEGFGLPPREFARTGGPVIATRWGGLADDLPRWGYPLKFKLVDAWPHDESKKGLGKWSLPDADHLCELMKYVASEKRFNLWKNGTKRGDAQAARVSLAIRNLYQWKRFASEIGNMWAGMSKKQKTTPVGDRRKRRSKA